MCETLSETHGLMDAGGRGLLRMVVPVLHYEDRINADGHSINNSANSAKQCKCFGYVAECLLG